MYVDLFSRVIERVRGDSAEHLRARYDRIRNVRAFSGSDPDNVYVLSRVTLCADVAVTSVVIDAVNARYPRARVLFVGSRKNWALFEADERIELHEFTYGRGGSLRDRLSCVPVLPDGNAIVVDPDSRLTQLGLLPIFEDDRYYFFESRAYGGESDRSLNELTREWVERVFGVAGARAYIAPKKMPSNARATVSFGVGENGEKRVSDAFEAAVLNEITSRVESVLLDTGAGGAERERAEHLASTTAGQLELWRGDYAPFASAIAQSRLYIGYDSAGQHVAAACGVPLVSVFAGYASERMFHRWTPTGPAPVRIVKVTDRGSAGVLMETIAATRELLA
jgi:ADP-heptose:LPS heptosyltransferase